ncbi:UNVERIFIED_CONTAM: hypothetical protein Sindi_2280200 [Sesamum indicum]
MTIGASPPSRGRGRGRVFGFSSEAYHWIAGPSQPQSPNIDDRVLALERYIRSVDHNWPDYLAPKPSTDPGTRRRRRQRQRTRSYWE